MISIERIEGVEGRERIYEDVFFCNPSKIDSICFNVKNQLGYVWLKDIMAIERGDEIELRYFFYFIESNLKFTLSTKFKRGTTVKSIAHIWLNASYMEQELSELKDIPFNRPYRNKLEVKSLAELNNYKTILANPLHSSTLLFSYQWKGDVIKNCDQLSGLYHSRLEEILKGESSINAQTFIERHFSHRGSLWSLAYTRSIELYNTIEIPDRAKALRMVMIELLRIKDHLIFFRNLHCELRHVAGVSTFISHIKRIGALMTSFSGNVHLHGINQVGGLRQDVEQAWVSRATDELEELRKHLSLEFLQNKSNLGLADTLDFKLLDKNLAYGRCLSGPISRCTGLNLDLRKNEPDYFYGDVEFEVPIGTSGSAFDLYSVKHCEILEAIKIIIQVLDNLPTGYVSHQRDQDISFIKQQREMPSNEDYMKSFKNFMASPDSNSSFFFEGPNGHIGISTIIKANAIEDINFYSNDFVLKNIFPNIAVGKRLDELALSWVSLGIDMKAVEK